MFLNQLEQSTKYLFLDVCVHAAIANDIFVDAEKEMIGAYCREMNIPENMSECNKSLDDVLVQLANEATSKEKNIIVLEILGLVKADGNYDDKEKSFMQKLISTMGIEENVLNNLEKLLDSYMSICEELHAAICK